MPTLSAPHASAEQRPPTECPRCGSRSREPYTQERRVEHGGTDGRGRPYEAVIFAWTACQVCGQRRVDRFEQVSRKGAKTRRDRRLKSGGRQPAEVTREQ